MNAAEDDDIGIGASRFTTESERIPDEVGDILDLWTLVVVSDDHSVALFGECFDLLLQRCYVVPVSRCRHILLELYVFSTPLSHGAWEIASEMPAARFLPEK